MPEFLPIIITWPMELGGSMPTSQGLSNNPYTKANIYFIAYFFTVIPLISFLSCRPFVINATFSAGLVV